VFVENMAEMPAAVHQVARDGDVVISMGAGSIGNLPRELAGGAK
jgi:UDP-N-acetylmuramate--alanine ligase